MQTVEGGKVHPRELSLLAEDESPTFAARPSYVTVGMKKWDLPLLLLTDRRMLLSKARLVGKQRADLSANWPEVLNIAGQPWMGWGPKIQFIVRTTQGDVDLIVNPEYAVEVESAIRRGYIH